jgi:minor histocompatibility antigen H13
MDPSEQPIETPAVPAATPIPETIWIAYVAMVAMAFLPIYLGSFRSLKLSGGETMTQKDAYMFPVYGSCFLFGLYIVFKVFSKELINYLLSAYFILFGIGAMVMTFSPVVGIVFPKSTNEKKYPISFKFLTIIPGVTQDMVEFTPTIVDGVTCFISLIFCVWYLQSKHWIANNILGFSFSLQAISMLNLGSFKIGCILLSGLFFYDIFWVFGTDVMVTVARSFDAPVKLLFPKDIFAETFQFSMLGLGDIVIPGIFIALMLRFDESLKRREGEDYPKPYFYSCSLAYLLGLITTILVMHCFQAAQPALLYLVPFCLGSSLLTGLSRGQIKELFAYEEKTNEKQD